MRKPANAASQSSGENATPAVSASADATARRTPQSQASLPVKPGSVVTKVAKFLINRGLHRRGANPKDGPLRQKVLASLKNKKSSPGA